MALKMVWVLTTLQSQGDSRFVPILLIGLYIACELIANVTASKPVQLPGNIVVPAAVFILPSLLH
jgi:uncharacterized PurR-regulated membrane protein YhhQ (DUF165 family)